MFGEEERRKGRKAVMNSATFASDFRDVQRRNMLEIC
jgi:hypothetical protein